MSDLFWLTEAQMARLEPFFPKPHGKPRVDDRRVLSGIIFVNRNGLWVCAGSGPLSFHLRSWTTVLLGDIFAFVSAHNELTGDSRMSSL